MGDSATQVYKRLSNLLSTNHGLSYGVVMGWVWCKLSFSLLQSATMCVRITRSSLRCPVTKAPIAVQSQKPKYKAFQFTRYLQSVGSSM